MIKMFIKLLKRYIIYFFTVHFNILQLYYSQNKDKCNVSIFHWFMKLLQNKETFLTGVLMPFLDNVNLSL